MARRRIAGGGLGRSRIQEEEGNRKTTKTGEKISGNAGAETVKAKTNMMGRMTRWRLQEEG